MGSPKTRIQCAETVYLKRRLQCETCKF